MHQDHRGRAPITLRSALTLGAALPALLTGLAAPLHAQGQGVSEFEPQEVQTPSIPVIVVTATKREQTLQETPVAVSVVSAEEIEAAEIQDLLDLQTLVPSLAVRQGQTAGMPQPCRSCWRAGASIPPTPLRSVASSKPTRKPMASSSSRP